MTIDPACGMLLDSSARETATYRDRRYFFCSAECRAAFVRNPAGDLQDPPRQRLGEAAREPAAQRDR